MSTEEVKYIPNQPESQTVADLIQEQARQLGIAKKALREIARNENGAKQKAGEALREMTPNLDT